MIRRSTDIIVPKLLATHKSVSPAETGKFYLLAYFPKVALCNLLPVCVSMYPPYQLLSASAYLNETWPYS
jgi:hypothetical protein